MNRTESKREAGTIRSFAIDSAAFSLIITSHFINYIKYLEYSRLFPDVAAVLGIVLLVGLGLALLAYLGGGILRAVLFALLITIVLGDVIFEIGVRDDLTGLLATGLTLVLTIVLALFLGRQASKVLLGAFAAVLATTLLLPRLVAPERMSALAVAPASESVGLPLFLHLVLDEHIGLAGMDEEETGGPALARDLEAFYLQHGFRLFTHAYSEYFDSPLSLDSALNFTSAPTRLSRLDKGQGKWTFRESRYFSILGERGYRARIFQSAYLDFCRTEEIAVEACLTYDQDKFTAPAIAALPLGERVRLLAYMYTNSMATVRLARFAIASMETRLAGVGDEALFRPVLWHGRIGPLATLEAIERLSVDLSRDPGDAFIFAHLLTPHYPYVLRSDCTVREPISTWKLRHLSQGLNTLHSRQERYRDYFEQVRCTLRWLSRIFEAMQAAGTFDEATIVIHGDHGSRINLLEPKVEHLPHMTARDHIDSFSTLFALKRPGLSPGTDDRPLPLSLLVPYALESGDSEPPEPVPLEAYFALDDENYIKLPIALELRP